MYPECSLYHYQISVTLSSFSVIMNCFMTLAVVPFLLILLLLRSAMFACSCNAKSDIVLLLARDVLHLIMMSGMVGTSEDCETCYKLILSQMRYASFCHLNNN